MVNFREIEKNGLVIISFAAALLYWYFDSLHPGELISRVFTSFLFITYGLFTQYLTNSYLEQRDTEAKYHDLLDHINDGIYSLNKDGYFTFANKVIMDCTGISSEKLYGYHYLDIVAPEDHESARKNFEKVMKSEEAATYELKYKTADGALRVMEINTTPIYGQGGIVGLQSISRNITERKRAEGALQQAHAELEQRVVARTEELRRINEELQKDITERKEIEAGLEKTREELAVIKIAADEVSEYAESVINTVREPLIALDQDLRVVTVSRSFYDFFKVKPEETVGQLIYDLGNKQWDIPKLRELLETILPEKATFDNYEVEHDFATIGRRTMLLNARQIQRVMGKERIILLAIEDITKRKESEEKIRQMVYHDSLTGLPNRKLFSDRLGIALAQAQRNQKEVGIAMLDLDHFKDVNDTLGHDMGDLLLQATAERLSAALRKGDTVARFGGDEFLLILPDLKVIEDAIQVAQKIVDSFHKPFLIDTHQLIVTTSIGIAVYPHDGIDEGILMKNADIAMYQVKQAGGDRYQLCIKA
jgi:diguanylate cyclase (GGDEF)-like protein/PAS domain S-box-containing protein